VERTGQRARQLQAEHYQAIARATRLGLPMREVAQAAGVTHGTIRAINNRLANQATESERQAGVQDPERRLVESEGHDAGWSQEQNSWDQSGDQ